MIRKAKSIRRQLPPVKLYIEDIGAIFKEASDKAEIETDEYKITNLNQLECIPTKKPKSIRFEIHEPVYITLDLRESDGTLYASSDSPIALGISHKIGNRLQQSSGLTSRFLCSYWTITAAITLMWVIIVTNYLIYHPKTNTDLGTIATSVGLIFLFLFPLMTWKKFKAYSQIILQRRQQVGFWARNRDQIAVGIIVFLAGTVFINLLRVIGGRIVSPMP
jgi:hypothetical protein